MIILEKPVVLAIDFNNFLFQSYYGEKLFNSKGQNINAIRGFFYKLRELKEALNPDVIVICNDISRESTFRRKLCKTYKANRKSKDDDILFQMKYTLHICGLLGYPIINHVEYEADDVLGMVSRYCMDNDMYCILVSSDKDLYQLVNDLVYVYSPRNKEYVDGEWLMEKYNLTPDEWIELKILQGDHSDNIVGVPGIGEVTALKLIREYHSVENIYSHLKELQERTRLLMEKGKNLIDLTRTLVTIITDYTKLDIDHKSFQRKSVQVDEIEQVLSELEIYSLYNVMQYSLYK